MFLGGSLSKFDRRCVSRIETYLRRFEVVRKCCLASWPVFLLDQIPHLFGWEESAVLDRILKNAFHLLLVHNFKFYFLQTSIKMNFRVGLNNRSLVSDASWGRYGVTETIQKTVSRSLDLVNNAIFFEVDEGWPSMKCQIVLRKWIWKCNKSCEGWKVTILYVLYFTVVLSSQTRWRIWSRRKTGRDAR